MRLHKVTWVILVATAFEFAADLIQAAAALKSYREFGATVETVASAEVLANTIKQFTYTAALLASAAMVEFLARIHSELRRLRPATGS